MAGDKTAFDELLEPLLELRKRLTELNAQHGSNGCTNADIEVISKKMDLLLIEFNKANKRIHDIDAQVQLNGETLTMILGLLKKSGLGRI